MIAKGGGYDEPFLMLGVLLQFVLSIVNRFVYELPNMVRIPLMILGAVLIIIGFVQTANLNT